MVKNKGRIGGFSASEKTNRQLFRAPSFYRGCDVFSLFPVVSYGNQQIKLLLLLLFLLCGGCCAAAAVGVSCVCF